jgi:hypothetical protein
MVPAVLTGTRLALPQSSVTILRMPAFWRYTVKAASAFEIQSVRRFGAKVFERELPENVRYDHLMTIDFN